MIWGVGVRHLRVGRNVEGGSGKFGGGAGGEIGTYVADDGEELGVVEVVVDKEDTVCSLLQRYLHVLRNLRPRGRAQRVRRCKAGVGERMRG